MVMCISSFDEAGRSPLLWCCDGCRGVIRGSDGAVEIRNAGPPGSAGYPSEDRPHVIVVYHHRCDPHSSQGYYIDCGPLERSEDVWRWLTLLRMTKRWFTNRDDLALCVLVADAAVRAFDREATS